jgi:hypothetical protein
MGKRLGDLTFKRRNEISIFSPLPLHFLKTRVDVAKDINRNTQRQLETTESQQSENDLLTERQCRNQELPMSLAWFRQRRLDGRGPPVTRISNRVFYRRGEVRRWIAAHQAAGTEKGQ